MPLEPPTIFWRSKKFYSATIGTLIALVPCLLSDPAMDRAAKIQMWQNFIWVAAGLWGVVIIAQGAADYAERRDAPSQSQQAPQNQVNIGAGTNVQGQPAVTTATQPPNQSAASIHLPPANDAIATDTPKGT